MKRTLSFILSIVLVISVFMVSERDVNAKTVKKSGYYYTVLRGKKSKGYNIYIKKIEIKGNKIITYGTFEYGKSEPTGKTIKSRKRTFVLSKKCKYMEGWGIPGGKKKISKKEAMRLLKFYYQPGDDSATCCIFKVKNGKVVKFMMGQS